MLLTTFTLTVLVDLTIAIEAGVVLAAFLFMKRMAEVTNITAVSREFSDDEAGGRTSSRSAAPTLDEIGEENIFGSLADALTRVSQLPARFDARG